MIKNSIDILFIVLPLLLLLMPLIRRIFFGKRKKVDGIISLQPWILRFSRTFFIVILLIIGIVHYLFFRDGKSGRFGPKAEPITVSKHSSNFNQSLQNILDIYFNMTDAFGGSDTTAISKSAKEFKIAMDSFKIDELKKDSLIYLSVLDPVANIKIELESIMKDPAIDEKRGSLNILSDNLRNILETVKYDLSKVYWQECANAFGEERPGNWLSKSEQSQGPYGKKDCAELKMTLNYLPDSTKK